MPGLVLLSASFLTRRLFHHILELCDVKLRTSKCGMDFSIAGITSPSSASGCSSYRDIFVVKYVLPSTLTCSVHTRVSSRRTPGFAPGFIGVACTPLYASTFGRALSANAARFLLSMSLIHSSQSRVLPGPSIALGLTCMDPFRARLPETAG